MKRIVLTLMLAAAAVACSGAVFAQGEEPQVYVIKKGDTLWGLSDRFLKDPHYWPNLWAKNDPSITNPHFIYPGQTVKIYPDRIVIEGPPPVAEAAAVPEETPVAPAKTMPEEVSQQKTFTVKGGAGFLLESEIRPTGTIVSTYQNRVMVGEDDIVYTDIGRKQGAKVGDRFSIFKNMGPISHPVTNFVMGNKIIPLGTLQLSEVEEQASKALITKSFIEIGAGSYLMPYRERKKEVALKAATTEMSGYIIETQTGSTAIAAGDIAFLDLGSSHGLEAGNMLYIVRDVVPDQQYVRGSVPKLPVEVLGVLVVVETGPRTSTALIVKSIDTIYPGDRVELKKSK
jgi:LysM repeat protein